MTREPPHILVVNYNETDASLLGTFLEEQGYDVTAKSTLGAVGESLDNADDLELALIDADGFPPVVWDRCAQLQEEGVPFLVLSLNPESVEDTAGAKSQQPVIEKPVTKDKLIEFIDSIAD